jgi:hypothetical protein
MKIPTISLSWHIKYEDIMKLYLDKFLIVDCRTKNITESLKLIDEFYEQRDWFCEEIMHKKQNEIENEIKCSIDMIVDDIKKVKL